MKKKTALRPIKFKAYLHKSKMFVELEAIRIQGNEEYEISFNNGQKGKCYDKDVGYDEPIYLNSLNKNDERFTIIPYTGFNDKYGNEIYENNLLELNIKEKTFSSRKKSKSPSRIGQVKPCIDQYEIQMLNSTVFAPLNEKQAKNFVVIADDL